MPTTIQIASPQIFRPSYGPAEERYHFVRDLKLGHIWNVNLNMTSNAIYSLHLGLTRLVRDICINLNLQIFRKKWANYLKANKHAGYGK